MTYRATLTLALEGPLLVGGHTSPVSDVDATTAKEGGSFIVPASALRGALREACTRLENARRAARDELVTFEPGPLTRELFGEPGPDRPNLTPGTDDIAIHSGRDDGASGRLRLTNARALEQTLHPTVRHGVGIDRRTGSAYPEHHFQREVAGAPGQTLSAEIVCSASDAAVALLKDAVELVTGVGNSQSRGLGHVRVSLAELGAAPMNSSVVVANDVPTDALIVDVEALEPLLLGGMPNPTNVRESLPYVPGSALRGALAFAALESGVSADDPEFQAVFVEPDTCLLFSDAHPFEGNVRSIPLPAPRSRLACKNTSDDKHMNGAPNGGERDTLVTGWLAARVMERGGTTRPFACPVCKRTLTAAKGWVPTVAHTRRVVTRLGRDVATGSITPGLLYSTVQIEPGARFRGTVGRTDKRARALIARISAEVRLGGLRNRGLGKVQVRFDGSSQLGRGAVQSRRRVLAKRLQPLLAVAAHAGVAHLPAPAGVLAVVARTDLGLPPETAPVRVGEAIFGETEHKVLAVAQTAEVRSGWCELTRGPRALRPVVAAGSAWLFSFEGQGPSDEHLARLEVEGLGEERELGLGRIVVAPTALMEGWE